MWPFKRKKRSPEPWQASRVCPFCQSKEVRVDASEAASPVKAWRGQRLASMKCLNCGKGFYLEATGGEEAEIESRLIEDEDALREAEEELKRQTDAEDDRRYSP